MFFFRAYVVLPRWLSWTVTEMIWKFTIFACFLHSLYTDNNVFLWKNLLILPNIWSLDTREYARLKIIKKNSLMLHIFVQLTLFHFVHLSYLYFFSVFLIYLFCLFLGDFPVRVFFFFVTKFFILFFILIFIIFSVACCFTIKYIFIWKCLSVNLSHMCNTEENITSMIYIYILIFLI